MAGEMKVVGYPSDYSGCSYYRILEPIAAAARAGVDAEVSYLFPNTLRARADGTDKVTGINEDFDADVVVFHRPLDYRFGDSVKHLRARGIGVVVDLDDDLHSIDASSGFIASFGLHNNPRENPEQCVRMCQIADVVTCSTPAVLRNWGFGHGMIVRNGIPPHVLEMEHVGGGGFGWSGSSASHLGDLEVVGDGVQQALDATGASFTIVGDGMYARERLRLRKRPAITGWVDAGKHFANITKLDYGIAPLSSTAFSRARSAIKVLEYAALGIPSVASALPEYELVAATGLCELARTPEEWREALVTLFHRHENRETSCFGSSLRSCVRESYTTDVTVTSAIDAWQLAAEKAQRRSRSRSPRSTPSRGRRRGGRP